MITFKSADNIIDFKIVFDFLNKDTIYPNFHHWFWNKVVPSVLINNDKIIICYSNKKFTGISIIKNYGEEKLRCFKMDNDFKKSIYVIKFLKFTLLHFINKKPLLSVSEDNFHLFSRIFINFFNFELVQVYKGLYSKGKLEYQFNGKKDDLKKTGLPY